MAIKRYISTKDTTITNAYRLNLIERATDANMGASDILEVFSIYGQADTTSVELSRALLQFDVAELTADRADGSLPESGSVSFYLRVFNAPHGSTLPRQYSLEILPASSSWTEGIGLDMESYLDVGEANWLSSSLGVAWDTEGGDYLSSSLEQYSDDGDEDLEVDVTSLVEEWLAGTVENNGVFIKMTDEIESGDLEESYYTKRFFGRGTEFFYKQPVLEARWNSARTDDRGNFYVSSPSMPTEDNLNRLYLYNRVRGRLRDIPAIGTGSIYVDFYDEDGVLLESNVTGSWESTGIYYVDIAIDSDTEEINDVWKDEADVAYYTGSIYPVSYEVSNSYANESYYTTISNLKSVYRNTEEALFRVYVRDRNANPVIYAVATAVSQPSIVESAYYRIFRVVDNYEVVEFGTGSLQQTKLSYDGEGNYFTFDMAMLEPGYLYGVQLAYYMHGTYVVQPEIFKFRVEE